MDELDISEKIELYKFLVSNGFEEIDEKRLKQTSLAKYGVEGIEKILNNCKKSTDLESCFGELISKILNNKKYHKCDSFNTLFSDIMMMKAESFDDDDNDDAVNKHNEYKNIYKFLGNILRGQIPDLNELNEKSMNILLSLIKDVQLIANTIDSKDLIKINNDDDNDEQMEQDEDSKNTLEMLSSIYKFQSISEFMNPLNIPIEWNERLLKLLLDKKKEKFQQSK